MAMDSLTPMGQHVRSADWNAAVQIHKRTRRSKCGTNVHEKKNKWYFKWDSGIIKELYTVVYIANMTVYARIV
jgi:hypothetical protein